MGSLRLFASSDGTRHPDDPFGEFGLQRDHEVTTKTRLKNVGVREFRDHATAYLSGSDPVAESEHGQVVGIVAD